jgi:hypothetical protein
VLLNQVVNVLNWVTDLQPRIPVAYRLENVATQHNFRHEYIRCPVYEDLVKRLGVPITFDAAQVGSYAHRVRKYWTNLAPRKERQSLFDSI